MIQREAKEIVDLFVRGEYRTVRRRFETMPATQAAAIGMIVQRELSIRYTAWYEVQFLALLGFPLKPFQHAENRKTCRQGGSHEWNDVPGHMLECHDCGTRRLTER